MSDVVWKPRKRKWPYGKVYWIVADDKGRARCGPNGMESTFSDRDHAQIVANEMNAAEPRNG